MTKLKSKKMTKSTLAIIIMGIAIVALLAFGGTFAFFTATATSKSATIATGTVELSESGAFETVVSGKLVPGDVLLTSPIQYTPGSDVKTIVILKYVVSGDDVSSAIDLNENSENDFNVLSTASGTTYYYAVVDAESTTPLVFINASAQNPVTFTLAEDDDREQDVTYTGLQGKTLSISIAARAIQFRGLSYTVDSEATTSADNSPAAHTEAIAKAAANALFNAQLTAAYTSEP